MEDLTPALERIFSRQALRTGELPGLDLYMDQVITLIENGYAANQRTPDEKLLTKTMVQNYSKAGLVRPIKGKKYTPEHIVQMLVIYTLKRTLSISEIKQALDAFYAEGAGDQTALAKSYEQALDRKEALAPLMASLFAAHNETDATTSERFSTLLTAAILSESFARLTEELLDTWFPPQSPQKRP